jgi:hypothetical protein
MRGTPTTHSPAIEARRLAVVGPVLGTNNVGMDALFAREVQFFVRRSPRILKTPLNAKSFGNLAARLDLRGSSSRLLVCLASVRQRPGFEPT